MRLGSLELTSPYLLAPMAGYTDKPFRYICKTYGAGLTFSELISVNAIYYNNKKTYTLLEKSNIEKPFCIQLFGYDSELFLYAAQKVEKLCDCIDINAGCPVSKVIKAQAGSYLLKDKKQLFKIVDKLKKHISKPISIKLRKGFDENSVNTIDFYKELENRGIDFITIHPRLRGQFFKGDIDYEHAHKVKSELNIDIVINGGIDSFIKMNKLRDSYGFNFFMIGQAAISKPYIFSDLIKGEDSTKDKTFIKTLMIQHLNLMVEYYGQDMALRNYRKFFHHYSRGIKFAKSLNEQINTCNNLDKAIEIIDKI